jgi:hypothetical protein
MKKTGKIDKLFPRCCEDPGNFIVSDTASEGGRKYIWLKCKVCGSINLKTKEVVKNAKEEKTRRTLQPLW